MSGVLMLKTVKPDMTSYNGFVWPKDGRVECPDWNPEPVCGGGLHGLPEGVGDGGLLDWSPDAVWLVFEADEIVAIDTVKAKANAATVVHCGDRLSATRYLIDHGCAGPVVGATITAGDYGTATAGDYGTATAGDYGTATAGDYGTATAGNDGTATAGNRGTATAGYRGTVIVKWWDGDRYRLAVGYVGEDGIEPHVPYIVRDGALVPSEGGR